MGTLAVLLSIPGKQKNTRVTRGDAVLVIPFFPQAPECQRPLELVL